MGRAKIVFTAVTILMVVAIAETGLAAGPGGGGQGSASSQAGNPGDPSSEHVPPDNGQGNPTPGPVDQADPNATGAGDDRVKPKDAVTTTTIAATTTTTMAPTTTTMAPTTTTTSVAAAATAVVHIPTTRVESTTSAPASEFEAVPPTVSDAIATLAGQVEPVVPSSAFVLAATSRLPLADVLAFVGDIRVETFLAAPLLALQILARALGSAGQGLIAPAAMLVIVAGLMARDRRLPRRSFGY